MNVGAALTRKIGPLPAWGWGVALGGAIVAARMLRGGGGSDAAQPTVISVPTGSPIGMGEDFASDLGNQLDQLRRDNEDRFEDLTDDWDDRFDDLLDAVDTIQTPVTNTPSPGGNGSIQPVTPKPSPVKTVAPTATRISRARAAEIIRSMGGDPAKVFGYGTNTDGSSFWLNNAAANYVWQSEESFRAWARRNLG